MVSYRLYGRRFSRRYQLHRNITGECAEDVPLAILQNRVSAIRTLLWCQPCSDARITNNNFFIATTHVQKAGNGLFTSQNIPAFSDVCFYEGFEHNFSEASKMTDKSYAMFLSTPALDLQNNLLMKIWHIYMYLKII